MIKNNNHNMKKILLTLGLMLMLVFSLSAQMVEKTFFFNNPQFEQYQNYEQITLDCSVGTLSLESVQGAEVGNPNLPWYSVSLLLPQNTEAQEVEFEFSDFIEIEGSHLLYPYQAPRPLSVTKDIPFAKNENVYASEDLYPTKYSSDVETQYLNGYSIALSGFTPVRYVPSTGKLSYAQNVTVRISYTTSRVDKSKMLNTAPEIKSRVERLAQNPELLVLYADNQKQRSISGYELLVITPEEWVSHFDEYKSFYDAKGLRTRVRSLEEIYSSTDGRDDQEKIRTYIAQEYENEGVMMVLLGGDSNVVPYRSLYCYVSSEYVDNLPADMYYVCLDGSWDDDNDGLWGEVGEDDLLPELAIARMPFNNEDQFNNMMHKTLEYQANPVLGEFNDIVFGGEHLGDGYYGSNDLELLIGEHDDDGYTTIGIPEHYTFHRIYSDGPSGWNGTIFRNKINEVGGGYVHHVGHANTDYVAGWYVNSTNDNSFIHLNGETHNYNFFHSHGCICGDFTSTCILERLVNISTGFVAATGNSRYGWYIPWGDGPARHLHREFVDSYYHDRLPYIGTAFVEMKIMTAPLVNMAWGENAALRWNFYCINILGDVAVSPWLDEPFIPEIEYEKALVNGTTSTNIIVNKEGEAQSNFRCSLFYGDDLIAFAMTDENGLASLELAEPLDIVDTLQLIITGPNAWCQNYDVIAMAENSAYVYADDIQIDDAQCNGNEQLDYDETVSLNINFYNPGTIAANNVSATLTTLSPEYVEMIDTEANVGNVSANSSISVNEAFSFKISDNIQDQEYVYFILECNDGTNTWAQELLFKVLAPVFDVHELIYDDSMGNNNGFVDPGETIQIHFSGKNVGHSLCHDLLVHASSANPYITFVENDINIEELDVNEEFTATMLLQIDDNTPDGEFFTVNVNMTSGSYQIEKNLMFTVGTVKEDFEVGDFSHLNWQFAYDKPWLVTDNQVFNGNYAAESGHIGDDEISSLIVEISTTTDGVISYYFKTSTEENRDYLVFYIDGQMQDRWSGENDWQQISYDIPSGLHTLEWRYDKNQRDSEGEDRCWIDDIVFPGNCMIMDINSVTENKNFIIYPNPANNFVVVEGDDIQEVELYNIMGVKLYSQEVENSKIVMDLDDVSNGMYLIRILDSDAKVYTKKIVKK
ncbi:MAG: T9SS type A sorting domain-containing protein [Lentimicrobiaceae bacterium]|nr:T9SS type A sorting domain-containing protein [Lentimicrobiaceae bacterium]